MSKHQPRRTRPATAAAALVCAALVSVVLSACGEGEEAAMLSGRPAALIETPVPGGAPAETEVVPEAVTPTTEPLPGLKVGDTGPEVLVLEQKLSAMRYWVGQVDEAYDADTRNAVMAFQKVTGMDRTGRATPDVTAAVAVATAPQGMVPAGGTKRVEIDLDRQVLFLFENNSLATILTVSTGSNQRFCSEGWCRRAVTPPGSFLLYSQVSGWEKSPLGWLYNSQYFNGGIAIHGSESVPVYPASHGCVRIPMTAADWFPERMSIGTPVYVVNSDEPHPAPIDARATPTSTPTTIVADTAPTTAPASTTTVPSLLGGLLGPPPSRP